MIPDEDSKKIVDKNLLHFCSEFRMFQVFRDICLSNYIKSEDILASLNIKNSPLKMISDDNCMSKVLHRLDILAFSHEVFLEIFFTICKHNLDKSMEIITKVTKPTDLISFCKSEVEGENALMTATIACSDQVLLTLISNIFLGNHCTHEDKDVFLHTKDQEGRTLLNLIIAQGDSLVFAKELMIKIERDFHRNEGQNSLVPLMECFQNKLGPSRDVAKALKDERAYLIPTRGKVKTWLKVFFLFLIPFSIIVQDVVTDSLLTQQYFKDMRSKTFDSNEERCQSFVANNCTSSMIPMIQELSLIARKLEPLPCFYYSLAFLLMPIGCYSIEWYFQESPLLVKQVS